MYSCTVVSAGQVDWLVALVSNIQNLPSRMACKSLLFLGVMEFLYCRAHQRQKNISIDYMMCHVVQQWWWSSDGRFFRNLRWCNVGGRGKCKYQDGTFLQHLKVFLRQANVGHCCLSTLYTDSPQLYFIFTTVNWYCTLVFSFLMRVK